MTNIFKKKPKGQEITLGITGMHCTSCAMNIDGALEDTKGVLSSSTSYSKARTTVEYDETVISKDQLAKVIENLDYQVEEV